MTIAPHDPSSFLIHRLSDPLKNRFEEGTRLFNRGEYWEAHEAWEDVWRVSEDPQKRLIQGLIQAAAAYHLILTDPRINGALRNIEKSLDKLEGMPDVCFGIRIDALRSTLQELTAEVRRVGQEGLREIDERCVAKL